MPQHRALILMRMGLTGRPIFWDARPKQASLSGVKGKGEPQHAFRQTRLCPGHYNENNLNMKSKAGIHNRNEVNSAQCPRWL